MKLIFISLSKSDISTKVVGVPGIEPGTFCLYLPLASRERYIRKVVGLEGVGPSLILYKSTVLPLNYRPIHYNFCGFKTDATATELHALTNSRQILSQILENNHLSPLSTSGVETYLHRVKLGSRVRLDTSGF